MRTVSYPNGNKPWRLYCAAAEWERDVARRQRDEALAEAAKWRNAHRSVVVSKRRLSAKYGRIMRRRPKALWRRAKKAIRRSVTKVTHKLGRVG